MTRILKLTKLQQICAPKLYIVINISTLFSNHCKRGTVYSQAFRLNKICSDPNSVNRRCNVLEKLLIQRGYSELEVSKQIVRTRGFSRDSLLNRKNSEEEHNKVTYFYLIKKSDLLSSLSNCLKKIFPECLPWCCPWSCFTNVVLIRFQNDWNFKYHIVRFVLPKIDAEGNPNHVGQRKVFVRYVFQLMICPILRGEALARRLMY